MKDLKGGHNTDVSRPPQPHNVDADNGAGIKSGLCVKSPISRSNEGGLGKPLPEYGTPPWPQPEVESVAGGFKIKNG